MVNPGIKITRKEIHYLQIPFFNIGIHVIDARHYIDPYIYKGTEIIDILYVRIDTRTNPLSKLHRPYAVDCE